MLILALAAVQPLIATNDYDGSRLIAMNLPGIKLPKASGVREPALSPDRKTILYWKSDGATTDAPMRKIDTTTGKDTLFRKGNLRSPGFNPKNTHIFYTEFIASDWKLEIQPIKGEPVVADTGDHGVFMPVWSPGNRALVVQDMNTVMWIDAEGDRIHSYPITTFVTSSDRISSSDCFTDRPGVWTTVAFTQDARGNATVRDKMTGFTGAIFIYDLVTKQRRRLTDENTYAQNPRWTADGQTIYFRGQVGKRKGIYKLPFNGGKPEKVTAAYGEFSL